MSESYVDVQIECVQCGQQFAWTAGEQKFYADRGHSKPKRCKKCREIRKAAAEQGGKRR